MKLGEIVNYNPDVLACLANLSSDEIFTPPAVANQMLDMLPSEIWKDKNIKFLDPVSKSGVFLREIAKRLNEGLAGQIPDLQTRVNHIFTKQLYGIAITELTSLLSKRSVYCSKVANGPYSVVTNFNSPSGNIYFGQLKHTWKNGKCIYCSASKEVFDRDDVLESHAYHFLHMDKPQDLFGDNMKFDVIIGNPPYQLNDGGHGRSASPIYQKFVEQAKKLNPRYLAMIIPARWFAGGKGLDEFRSEMLNDERMRKLVDFENSSEVFPGVDIAGGVCYFLWESNSKGPCEVTNFYKNESITSTRKLNEFDIFIRHSRAVPIIRKIQSKNENEGRRLNDVVSSRKPFGLPTNYGPKNNGTPCWFIQKIGLKFCKTSDIKDDKNLLDKWKLLIPKSPIAGQTDFSKPVGFYYDGNVRIAKPGECCTESWIVAGAFKTKNETESFKSYLFTKIVRFLLLQTVVSQDVTRQNFVFVPDLGNYEGTYTDKDLIKRWGLSAEEWDFIDSKISASDK